MRLLIVKPGAKFPAVATSLATETLGVRSGDLPIDQITERQAITSEALIDPRPACDVVLRAKSRLLRAESRLLANEWQGSLEQSYAGEAGG